jgi:hypothetical protein
MALPGVNDIKFNCDVSDAKYWGYFSICGLLMRYRDLYRSEEGLAPWAVIPQGDITQWIHEKESQWPDLEQRDFRNVTIGNRSYDPFDASGINDALRPHGLLYGAGYGIYMKPTFFLAELASTADVLDHPVSTTGRELARDLFAAPAMLQGRSIFLRIEPLTALLWDKFAGLGGGCCSPLAEAFASFGLVPGRPLDAAFEEDMDRLARSYSHALLRHELAESLEDAPAWRGVIASTNDRSVEHFLRAVKDLIADTSEHGPYRWIVSTRDRAALSLSISFAEGYRKVLFPELRKAHEEFVRTGDWSVIEASRLQGYTKFLSLRDEILRLYRDEASEHDRLAAFKAMIHRAMGPS